MRNRPAEERVLLGMPSYGHITAGASRAFWLATARSSAAWFQFEQGSLLAEQFNRLWCRALNLRHRGERCDYFAMLHADVEPADGWLDVLIDELHRADLDVLAAVVPIKDGRGVTSTAVAHPSGDPWRIARRLTTTEAHRLPETFTSADVGGPLLLNTGCWVCRFDPAWAAKVRFTINDRIAFDERHGLYVPQVEPEDWYFSRLLHERGLRVGATRRVPLKHVGEMRFDSTQQWGEEFDSMYADAPVVPATPRA